jgi:putative ABC transport system permease protein
MATFRLALRSLLRDRGFTLAAIACLALGAGATTAIFSVLNAVVLRPLPYRTPESLVRIYTEFPTFPGGGLRRFWTSGPEFLELRRDLKSWRTIDAWQTGGVNIAGAAEPVRANAAFVSGTLLETLGVQPRMGRLLTAADDLFGAPRAAVISEGLWRSAFGADPGILSRDVRIDGAQASIVGVMPGGFQFPPGDPEPADVWTTIQLNPASPGSRGGHRFYLLGRLRDGVTLAQAKQEMTQYVNATGATAGPGRHVLHPQNHPLVVYPLQDEVTGNVRPALVALFAAVGFVLLIACGNVANLLLARAEARQREIAVRQALGAGGLQFFRQFVAEGLILGLSGALFGLAIARLGLAAILRAGAVAIPRAHEVGIDGAVLAFSLVIALLTGVVFGLAPLLYQFGHELAHALKAGSRTTATRESHRLRALMIAGEIAMAVVLVAGAGFAMRAFWKLQQTRLGFKPDNLLTMRVALPPQIYREGADVQRFWSELQPRLAALPGVVSSSIVSGLPPIRPLNANDTEIEGFVPRPDGPRQNVDYYQVAGDRYFETMGIQLLGGRLFTSSDGPKAPPVVIVNETFERLFYPGQSALGRRVRPSFTGEWRTIVGVVADVRNGGLDRPAGAELFIPSGQSEGFFRAAYIVVRAGRDPLSLASAVRSAVQSIDPNLPVAQIRTMDEVLERAQARPRFLALLLGLFSAVALGLAALGIYALMSYAVTRRTSEFGIRIALGAQSGDVLTLVLKQAFRLGVAGLIAGAAATFALNRLLRGNLAGFGDFDPVPFATAAAILLGATLAASLAPARRATRTDPLTSLREE